MTDETQKRQLPNWVLPVCVLVGFIAVMIVALVFSQILRCRMEYQVNEVIVALLALLLTAISGILIRLLPSHILQAVLSLFLGAMIALLISLLMHSFLLSPVAQSECPGLAPSPTTQPVPSPGPTDTPDRAYVAPGVWLCPDDTEGAQFVGSEQSNKYHRLSCKWAKEINPRNRLCFASRAAAVSYGYIPCQVCND